MKRLFILFIVVAIAQLFVPAKMIFEKQVPIYYGQELKFKTQPIDPYDPFRGKYVTLNFANNSIDIDHTEKWGRGEEVFVVFKKDREGFAVIKSIHKNEPTSTDYYLKTKVNHIQHGNKRKAIIRYPFTRYYMEESKADEAERLTMRFDRRKRQTISATVSLYKGEATVTGLQVNDIAMKDAVLRERERSRH